jgi:hypothetical protein
MMLGLHYIEPRQPSVRSHTSGDLKAWHDLCRRLCLLVVLVKYTRRIKKHELEKMGIAFNRNESS